MGGECRKVKFDYEEFPWIPAPFESSLGFRTHWTVIRLTSTDSYRITFGSIGEISEIRKNKAEGKIK